MWKPWTLVLTKSISSKTVYCCFSYGGSLDFPEFLQNSFITSTVGSTYKAKTFQIGASKLESPTATKSRERERENENFFGGKLLNFLHIFVRLVYLPRRRRPFQSSSTTWKGTLWNSCNSSMQHWSWSSNLYLVGSGYGSVGRAVASNSIGLLLEFSHWQNLYWSFTVNCIEKRK